MSLENHPNFHAVQFTVDILVSFNECLRGNANKKEYDFEALRKLVVDFVDQCESIVDASVNK